jgi:hypothetical protein
METITTPTVPINVTRSGEKPNLMKALANGVAII